MAAGLTALIESPQVCSLKFLTCEQDEARTVEKRTMTSQVAFLPTKIGPATPAEVRASIMDWIATQIDSMHGVNVRNWSASNDAITRGNDLVDVIDAKCGFS